MNGGALFIVMELNMKTSLKSTSSKLCRPSEMFRACTSPCMGSSTEAKGPLPLLRRTQKRHFSHVPRHHCLHCRSDLDR